MENPGTANGETKVHTAVVEQMVALVLEYEGTRYAGFQIQQRHSTVQGELEKALASLTGESIRITGAGRTDAGAHAQGQVVSFKTTFGHPPATFVSGLNHFLPDDIRVLAAYRVPRGFNARRSAQSRVYRYVVFNRKAPSPFIRHLVYHVSTPLDVEAMRKASRALVGQQDFAAFSSPLGNRRRRSWRWVHRFEIEEKGAYIIFEVEAPGFLPQQVRRMVGALLEVGQGKGTVEGVRQLAESGRPSMAGPCPPATGLYLRKVRYLPCYPQGENYET